MGRISPLQFKRGVRSLFAPPFAVLWFAFLEVNIHQKSTEGKPTDCSHGNYACNYAGVVFRCKNSGFGRRFVTWRQSRCFRRKNSGPGRRFMTWRQSRCFRRKIGRRFMTWHRAWFGQWDFRWGKMGTLVSVGVGVGIYISSKCKFLRRAVTFAYEHRYYIRFHLSVARTLLAPPPKKSRRVRPRLHAVPVPTRSSTTCSVRSLRYWCAERLGEQAEPKTSARRTQSR